MEAGDIHRNGPAGPVSAEKLFTNRIDFNQAKAQVNLPADGSQGLTALWTLARFVGNSN